MLSCQQITELVTEYLEGRLSLVERLRFQMHLGMCHHCRRYLSQMKTTIRTLGLLGPGTVPEVPEELMRRFRAWKEQVP